MIKKLRKIRLLPALLTSTAAQAGQLTMFLAVTLIIIICLLAFIINVGLFVRAKINLQNAVDAAAYAGAATQARLLSQIAYVNWEMRNNYKEWLFKYYVLGQVGNPTVLDEGPVGSDDETTKFRTRSFEDDPSAPIGYHPEAFDPFNLPTICIHPGGIPGISNICARANVPGIPRFNTVGLPAISEKTEEFLNVVVTEKAKDCSVRTDLNYGTGMTWTYGAGGGSGGVANQAFAIAADRVGVWPKAMELSFRIRNLEMLLNRPPVSSICFDGCPGTPGSSLIDGTAINERPLKAFYSAWRNLDGGDSSSHQDLKRTFKLYELAPKSSDFQPKSLSGYLIKNTDYPSVGGSTLTKYYVDLQIMPVNYAIFFTAFVAQVGTIAGVVAEGECIGSKTAIPVPGLPVGFVKNPNLITYYAVKGEAQFTGLFYPFKKEGGITLTAYAAAKPMGGRIGPRYFATEDKRLTPRSGNSPRSAHELVGLTNGGLSWGYAKGRPIPFTSAFYVTTPADTVGGSPDPGTPAKFAIPNLIFDYAPGLDTHEQPLQNLVILEPLPGNICRVWNPGDFPVPTAKGLFKKEQFKKFFGQLGVAGGSSPTAQDVMKGILRVRRPTKYEAMNYLIPTYYDTTKSTLEGPSVVVGDLETDIPSISYVNYRLFAPLMGPDTLYLSEVDLAEMVDNHINDSQDAVKNYLTAIKEVASAVRALNTAGATSATDGNSLADAANLIYPNMNGVTPSDHLPYIPAVEDANDPACQGIPMATKFAYFFQSAQSAKRCGILPIGPNFKEYFARVAQNGGDKFLYTQFILPDDVSPDDTSSGKYMTGFMPGYRQGAEESTGSITHPFTNELESVAKRNYYSVKFVALSNLLENQGFFNSNFTAYLEKKASMGNVTSTAGVYASDGFKNSLDPSQGLSLFPSLDY